MAVVPVPYTPSHEPVEEFVEFNGAKFRTVSWNVPETITRKGKVIFVHGFAESAPLYTEFFDNLNKAGYDVFFFDQRGAGETSPDKLEGKTDEFHTFNDLDFFIKRNYDAREDKTEKFFLGGHSMGGGIVLNYGIRGKYRDYIKGIFTSGPLIKLHPDTQPNVIVRTLSPVINALVPGLKIDSKLNYDYITSNEKWKKYIIDSNKKLIGTVRQFNDMFARGDDLNKKEIVAKFSPNIALLVLHGTGDHINWIKGTEDFIALLPENVDKQFYPIEDARHSLFIEREGLVEDIREKVIAFLDKH
ncbi:Alpha/Beta hydrolase protein [Scheffersomyces xylosifermentans]|uniref:Alpha/Beta hydrolase protein n=1 Tax=Scheffersomyces xylosifermentans TaxID=1304137 RepID=UPI00315C8677